MESFTPVSASLGGVLIGLAAVILMLANGKISGISGLVSGAMFVRSDQKVQQALFVAGLIAAPVLYSAITGEIPSFEIEENWVLIILGGLLVGFGTRLGSGCTSGHGVCGISRLSLRSLTAVAIFMGVAMATVSITKLALGG
jgi:uncharacterized membrane protein YedE/YeeE